MSKQRGRGGMGSHKHGVSGTAGPNRRALQALGRLVNRMHEETKRPKQRMFDDVRDLFARKGKRR